MFRCGQVDVIFGASVMIHSVQFYKNQPSLTTVIFITDFSDPLMPIKTLGARYKFRTKLATTINHHIS